MSRDSSVILLYGNDEFAIRRRLSEFDALFTDASSASMNTARLEARTMSEDDLNNAVNAMPFLANQRLVILASPSARYATPQARKKFCEFIEKAPPTAKLVITESIEPKEEAKHWLVKWVGHAGLGLERFVLPVQAEMPGWITRQAKEQAGQIEPHAAARLAEMVGPDPRQAAQEIAKLLTYVNWARPINVEDVQAVCIVTAEAGIFDMVDALAVGNGKAAQLLLRRMLEDEDAFRVWPMVIRQFRLLLLAREVIDHHGGEAEAAQALGVSPFVAKKACSQARRFSLPVLEKIYHKLLEIDEAAKTGRMPLDLSMEMLVMELTN
jgi:DNA polymerase III subunit delta